MTKLIVYIAFTIYCQAANQNQARNAAPPAQAAAGGVGGVGILFEISRETVFDGSSNFSGNSTSSSTTDFTFAGIKSQFRPITFIRLVVALILAAEIITDYKADELWEDGRLIATKKVNKCMFISYKADSLVLFNAQ
ncbi:hypothetical protein LOAG_18997 [Loa loa]|uniref:Uncharacterized protein n=1 Tax=Loa loa TaxID=7209 RepID=A0A1S0UFE5_LOALO|nr:hypothetical protein LOAG_18997 [Loa loa]EJD73584.1 hypothetical protein LOAG_18997 [Loa loa]